MLSTLFDKQQFSLPASDIYDKPKPNFIGF